MPAQAPPRNDELLFAGARARVLTTGEQTGKLLGLVDMIEVPAGQMPPLHVHHREDEGFYVLEGELTLFLPGRRIDAGPGDFVLAPCGVPHAYRVGDTPGRWLVSSTPAGFECFVVDAAGLSDDDPEALTRVAARHGIEILGPPGMLP